jgi:GT2 family glycosyltransferase
MTMPDSSPAVSALVCTRNRGVSLVRTVRSLLQSPGPFEVIVIDQSDDEAAASLPAELGDPRLRYIRSGVRGKGAALNQGLQLAAGDVVVCTDDDCEAPAGWVMGMASVMNAHPRVAVLFCNVIAPPYDRAAGYVPAYERDGDRVLSSILEARHGLGLGAGMAVRRQAVLKLGGFDEAFGPGSRFASGDDWDISLRAMLGGWDVFDTASLSVLHYGFRTLAEGKAHARRDWIAIGALCAKPIRAGYGRAIGLSLWLFGVEALWPPVRDLLRLKRPSGLSRVVGFALGFAGGLRTAVDQETLLFRAPR